MEISSIGIWRGHGLGNWPVLLYIHCASSFDTSLEALRVGCARIAVLEQADVDRADAIRRAVPLDIPQHAAIVRPGHDAAFNPATVAHGEIFLRNAAGPIAPNVGVATAGSIGRCVPDDEAAGGRQNE